MGDVKEWWDEAKELFILAPNIKIKILIILAVISHILLIVICVSISIIIIWGILYLK